VTRGDLQEVASRFGRHAPTAEVRRTARAVAREMRDAESRAVIELALELFDRGLRFPAYEIVDADRRLVRSLRARDVASLARGLDSWGAVDAFACFVSGPAWREGGISETRVHAWARSRDRWLRRAAVVSTVPLNVAARGGSGDATRTLAVCALVVGDRDPMVVKALSWALRALAPSAPTAVELFLARHRASLASLVVREVTTKMRTGRKRPPRSNVGGRPTS